MDLELRAGMYVLSIDGQALGRIARIRDDGIEVVRGERNPQGFSVPHEEIASRLRAEIFLRQRLRDYLESYRPASAPAPRPKIRKGAAGKRFHLFRRVDAHW